MGVYKQLFDQASRRAFFVLLAVSLAASQLVFVGQAKAAPEYADAPFTTNHASPMWVSGDGRYVGVSSQSSLNGDGLGGGSFIRDRQNQVTTRALALDDDVASLPAISNDLRFGVVVTAQALVPTDNNGTFDVYIVDLQDNSFELVSVSTAGVPGNGISEATPGREAISSDGRFVVFRSFATNLDSGLDTNGGADVFMHDRQAGTTRRLSSDASGNAGNGVSAEVVISNDGSTVAFGTNASSLVDEASAGSQIVVEDIATGQRYRASHPDGIPEPEYSACGSPSLSADGQHTAFRCTQPLTTAALSGFDHAYRFDKVTDQVVSVDILAAGGISTGVNNVMISGDGKRVIHDRGDHRAYVWNESAGLAQLLANNVQGPLISANGEVVAAQEIGNGSRAGVWTLPPIVADVTAPSIVPQLSTAENSNGWHNSAVTLSWSVTDAQSPITSQNGCSTITVNSEAAGSTYTCSATSQGGTNSQTVTIRLDSTNPSLGALSWSMNPKSISQQSTLTVPVSDNLSGIEEGEYFVGDTDPGEGNGAVMNWDGTNLSTTFGTDFPTGVYKISVRAKDNAGNWSEPKSDYLVVYETGYRMTGRRTLLPSLTNGDILPGLITNGQADQAIFAFSVKHDGSGQVSGNSDFQFKYSTGSGCNGNNPQNCHSFELDAGTVAWFATQGTNNSEGVFQGTAALEVDGVSSNVIYRVTGLDGVRLSSTSPDHFTMFVYTSGADPNTATPLYRVDAGIARGNIKIVN